MSEFSRLTTNIKRETSRVQENIIERPVGQFEATAGRVSDQFQSNVRGAGRLGERIVDTVSGAFTAGKFVAIGIALLGVLALVAIGRAAFRRRKK